MPKQSVSRVDHIIDIARGAAPVGPGERENREAKRVPYHGQIAMVLIEADGEKRPAIILDCQDISTGGIGAVAPEQIARGTRGAILIRKSNGDPVLLGGRLVYSRPRNPRGFETGIEFELDPPAVLMDDFRDASGKLPNIGSVRAA